MKTENIWRNLKSLVHALWLVSSYEYLTCAASLCANFPKVSASKLRLAESDRHCKARHKIRIYTNKRYRMSVRKSRIWKKTQKIPQIWAWTNALTCKTSRMKVFQTNPFSKGNGYGFSPTGTRGMPGSQVWMQYKMLAFRLANLVRDFHANKCCVTVMRHKHDFQCIQRSFSHFCLSASAPAIATRSRRRRSPRRAQSFDLGRWVGNASGVKVVNPQTPQTPKNKDLIQNQKKTTKKQTQ